MKDFFERFGVVLVSTLLILGFLFAKQGQWFSVKVAEVINQADRDRYRAVHEPRSVRYQEQDYIAYLQYSEYGDKTLAPDEYKGVISLLNRHFSNNCSTLLLYDDGRVRLIVDRVGQVGLHAFDQTFGNASPEEIAEKVKASTSLARLDWRHTPRFSFQRFCCHGRGVFCFILIESAII